MADALVAKYAGAKLYKGEGPHREEAVAKIRAAGVEVADGASWAAKLNLSASDAARLHDDAPGRQVLVVTGDLDLSKLNKLCTLPENLVVLGSLDLGGCGKLQGLPENLAVSGTLNLAGCHKLVNIPPIRVGDKLVLESYEYDGMRKFESIDTSSRINSVDLFHESVRFLPNILKLTGVSLQIIGNDKIKELPVDRIEVKNLTVAGCPRLTFLAKEIIVEDKLMLYDVREVKKIANTIKANWVELSYCTFMNEIADEFAAKRLVMVDMSNVSSLPPNASVTTLRLENCMTIPAFKMGEVGTLEIMGRCPKKLREGIKLTDDLVLGGNDFNTNVQVLPADLELGGDLAINNCQAISSIPASYFHWGPNEDGDPHTLEFVKTSIPELSYEWLNKLDGPNIAIEIEGKPYKSTSSSMTWAVSTWSSWAGIDMLQGIYIEDSALDSRMAKCLDDLREVKEAAITEVAMWMGKRVISVLEKIANGEDLERDHVTHRIDAVAELAAKDPQWALVELEIAARAAQIGPDYDALRELARGQMRLEVLREHAVKKANDLPWADNVYPLVSLQDGLREALSLPVEPSNLVIPAYAVASESELSAAKEAALEASTDDKLDKWLESWAEHDWLQRQEAAKEIVWDQLPKTKDAGRKSWRASLAKRLSLSKQKDGVRRKEGGEVWSLAELLAHWVETEKDLAGEPMSVEQLESELLRI